MSLRGWHWRLTRDAALFLLGFAGLAHELFISDVFRPEAALLAGALAGVPAFLRKDEKELPQRCPECFHLMSEHGPRGCMFCACQRTVPV